MARDRNWAFDILCYITTSYYLHFHELIFQQNFHPGVYNKDLNYFKIHYSIPPGNEITNYPFISKF